MKSFLDFLKESDPSESKPASTGTAGGAIANFNREKAETKKKQQDIVKALDDAGDTGSE